MRPGSRHQDRATTHLYAERVGARWRDGLSHWTVRLAATGEVLGSGGVKLHEPAIWNLIAWIDEANTASRHVAERLGLIDHGVHVQRLDGAPRLAYVDRPLHASALDN